MRKNVSESFQMNTSRLSITLLVFLGFITRMFALDPKPEISGDYLLLQGRWTVLRNEIRNQRILEYPKRIGKSGFESR